MHIMEQLPRHLRRKVLVRTDSGGGTHEFLKWLTARSQRLRYSARMTITEDVQAAIGKVPAAAWTPAYDGDWQSGTVRGSRTSPGCSTCRPGLREMRVIVRKERPHPGAQAAGNPTACGCPSPAGWARGGRRLRLRLAERWPWTPEITTAITPLQALPSG